VVGFIPTRELACTDNDSQRKIAQFSTYLLKSPHVCEGFIEQNIFATKTRSLIILNIFSLCLGAWFVAILSGLSGLGGNKSIKVFIGDILDRQKLKAKKLTFYPDDDLIANKIKS
jgi:hypothetical protein